MARNEFSFIDLFAGIGGVRLGFERAGGRCVFTSEWDKFARKTYAANFGLDEDEIAGDIWQVPVEEIPDHDVLTAGFPCQPFSLAGVSKKNALGKAHGFACEAQGTLFFRVAEILRQKRPAAFMLENVKNLRSHDRGKTFTVIMDVLQNELGYHVYPEIIDGQRWTPQHRERIYIVGFREPVDFDWSEKRADWPALGSVRARDVLLPNHKVPDKYTLTDGLWSYLQAYRLKHERLGNGFGYSIVRPDGVTRTLSQRYYKDGSEILVHQRGKNPRRLTPRECARLMGFPEDFEFVVSDLQLYRQFGNSVVVPAVTAVADAIKPHLPKSIGPRPHRSHAKAGAALKGSESQRPKPSDWVATRVKRAAG